MDLEVFSSTPSPSKDMVKCCNCGCSCSLATSSLSEPWLRSVKRKHDEFEEGNRFHIFGLDISSNPRVEIENECTALREMVSGQQLTIQDLYTELEEERNAASSAANEAMSMIVRLQREKAEIQMEARQFKRFAEEKMGHDQQELYALEEVLYKREQAIQSLSCEVQAYKHRMMSYGLTETEAEGEKMERGRYSRIPSINENLDSAHIEFPAFDYPPLRCSLNENPSHWEEDDDSVDIEKYAFGETPRADDDPLKNLEYRIHQMERSPRGSQEDVDFSGAKNILEKVVVGQSPRKSRHYKRHSMDSPTSYKGVLGTDYVSESPRNKFNNSFKTTDYISPMEENLNFRKVDNPSEYGDDTSDRVYTIDSVHNGEPYNGVAEPKGGAGIPEDYTSTPRDSLHRPDMTDPDIKKLYMRLQALEADRESMRQAIISMRTEKAQMVLLKEIAQHLCKEASPERRLPVKRASVIGNFSFFSVFKWAISFVFWRRKARQSKYTFGLSASNVGLLLLLDRSPNIRQWRCLTSSQV